MGIVGGSFKSLPGSSKPPLRVNIILERRSLKPSAESAKFVVAPISLPRPDGPAITPDTTTVTTAQQPAPRPDRPASSQDTTTLSSQDATTLSSQGATTSSTPSTAISEPFLDIRAPGCGNCFRKSFSPVHASALVIESSIDLPALNNYQYFVHYVNSEDSSSALHFAQGRNAVLWPADQMGAIPYADLALDVVVVNNSAFGSRASGLASCLSEAARVLVPAGVLLLLEPFSALPKFDLQALVKPTTFGNAYKRLDRAVGMPECQQLRARGDGSWPCQPKVPNDFVNLDNKAHIQDILRHKSLADGRYSTSLVRNVWHGKQAEYLEKRPRYSGHKGTKSEWTNMPVLEQLVRTKKVQTMLDAGAGSCAMYGVLVQSGLMDIVPQPRYMAYGGYDPGYYRFCGERGTASFDHSWLYPHPFCSSCKFDLVFQFEGVHHTEAFLNHTMLIITFNNFDAVLKCGGWLMLQDSNCVMSYQRSRGKSGCKDESQTWEYAFRKWADSKGYVSQPGTLKNSRLFYQKKCKQHLI
eukprot:TRINITY_DN18370_c0_g1_i1.p1 TRINITY_DN18370_c0_g1~~TRINITY_DN18370_c0_g1_i1.p1  ORF type:complete len:579 (-),score=78.45 TRINITY_DN18370_c0_g1_i1:590-2167(-)